MAEICKNILFGQIFFWKNLNVLSWIELRSFRPERKIFYRSEPRWGLWEEDGSGAEDEIRDFRLKRDILSVWNILIGHSRMVKNDSRMNRNQILKWETFYFKTTNYTSTNQNQTSHTFYADTLQTRVFTQFHFIKKWLPIYPNLARNGTISTRNPNPTQLKIIFDEC